MNEPREIDYVEIEHAQPSDASGANEAAALQTDQIHHEDIHQSNWQQQEDPPLPDPQVAQAGAYDDPLDATRTEDDRTAADGTARQHDDLIRSDEHFEDLTAQALGGDVGDDSTQTTNVIPGAE